MAPGLCYKLLQREYPLHLVKLVASFLKGRTFKVRLSGAHSGVKRITAGVPQGSSLSPLLYNIYASDLPSAPGVMMAQYADDTAILYRSKSASVIQGRLQNHLDELHKWYSRWRVSVNAEKSEAVHFTWRRRGAIGPIELNGAEIPWKQKAKYLGVTLDSKLTWNAHINEKVRQSKIQILKLAPIISRRSCMSIGNKLRLYKTIMRPQMLYAVSVWGIAPASYLKKLQTRQNKILRMITGDPWYVRNAQIHKDLKMPTITEYIQELATNFYASLEVHPSSEMRDLTTRHVGAVTRHRRPQSLIR